AALPPAGPARCLGASARAGARGGTHPGRPQAGRGGGGRGRGATDGAAARPRRGAGALHEPADHPKHGEARALRGHLHGRAGAQRMKLYTAIALVALAASIAGAQPWGGRPWNQLTPDEQERAWQNYRRYRQLPEEQQRGLERRYERFRSLPPEEQQRLRDTYQRYRGLPREERREFTEKYRRWRESR